MKFASYIQVSAQVRYWEDTYLNGVEDTDGKIPCRNGELWEPVINLQTGEVLGWPEGNEAMIHYKVCDAGEYWLLDEQKNIIAKYKDYYVPDSILCVGDKGYGDYIIFSIGKDGKILNWKNPNIHAENWDYV